MTLSLAVVCEAAADQQTGCDLADRVVCDAINWIEPDNLEYLRQWRGFTPAESHLPWKNVGGLARQCGIRAHGHFKDEPGAPDAHAARLALLLFVAAEPGPDAVLLLRDDDRQKARRTGLQQARDTSGIGIPIVIGLAHPKRECWVLAGFDPRNAAESERLDAMNQQLGFDPRHNADGLTATHSTDKRDAKRVLDVLTDGDRDRQAACWKQTDLAQLEARGQKTGLRAYLGELREKLPPLFTKRPKPS